MGPGQCLYELQLGQVYSRFTAPSSFMPVIRVMELHVFLAKVSQVRKAFVGGGRHDGTPNDLFSLWNKVKRPTAGEHR